MKGFVKYMLASGAAIALSNIASAAGIHCAPKSENPAHDNYFLKLDLELGAASVAHEQHTDSLKRVDFFESDLGLVHFLTGKDSIDNSPLNFYYFEDAVDGTLSLQEEMRTIHIYYKCKKLP